MTTQQQPRCMTVSQMQFLLAKHGYRYGQDAAENALVGYELALTMVIKALPPELATRIAMEPI